LADASLYAIGSTRIARDARIIDVAGGAWASLSMARLDGARISAEDVLYYKAVNGEITALILNDATGDCGSYGVITLAKKNASENSVSGEYSWMIDGVPASAATQGSAFSVGTGPAKIVFSGNSPESMRNLKALTSKVRGFTGSDLSCDGEIPQWRVSEKAGIYYASTALPTQYAHATLSDALAAYAAGQSLDFYYDETPENGGQIRVILIRR
jgi:hypothetical protein